MDACIQFYNHKGDIEYIMCGLHTFKCVFRRWLLLYYKVNDYLYTLGYFTL